MASITRGAKLMKPAPRSGSMVMMRSMRSEASPSSSASPSFRPSDSSTAASTHTVPGAGPPVAASSGPPAVVWVRNRPRSG